MNYKVLVVDDSKLARMAVAKLLGAAHPGWTRLEAANADEASAVLREDKPDFAILDFNMPGRDGLNLAAQFREMNPGMPIAVISANHQQEIIDRANAVGATFLFKPLTEHALNEFLTRAVLRLKAAGHE